MPVLESTDLAAPRSALRHRPLERDADRGKSSITPVAQRASRLKPPQTEEEEQAIPTGRRSRGRLREHSLLLLGLGMVLMLVLWTGLSVFANWWNTTWD